MSLKYPKVSVGENVIFILTLVVLVIFVFGVSADSCHARPTSNPDPEFVL